MKKHICSSISCLLAFFLLVVYIMMIEAQQCQPSGAIKGSNPPEGQCSTENGDQCCQEGNDYTTYTCSPPVSQWTQAILTKNSFAESGDGGAPSECDDQYQDDNTLVVALSTGWFNNMARCNKYITIYGNGRSVNAMVVDECDSTMGCDSDHAYQPPCQNNFVDASKAVWEALGVEEKDWGWMDISWSDA